VSTGSLPLGFAGHRFWSRLRVIRRSYDRQF
jgi:hypothetical protein